MDFRPSEIKEAVLDVKQGLIDRYKETRRVLKITEKPDREEFEMSAKVTGAGMLIIGLIGFIFYLASNLIPQMFGSTGQEASQGIILLAGTLKGFSTKEEAN